MANRLRFWANPLPAQKYPFYRSTYWSQRRPNGTTDVKDGQAVQYVVVLTWQRRREVRLSASCRIRSGSSSGSSCRTPWWGAPRPCSFQWSGAPCCTSLQDQTQCRRKLKFFVSISVISWDYSFKSPHLNELYECRKQFTMIWPPDYYYKFFLYGLMKGVVDFSRFWILIQHHDLIRNRKSLRISRQSHMRRSAMTKKQKKCLVGMFL